MRTVIKRRFTNSLTAKVTSSKPRKASEDGGLSAAGRVRTATGTATKRTFLPRVGLIKTIWSNRRWRRALANYYVNAAPASAAPESTPEGPQATNCDKETIATPEENKSKDKSAADDFYTFDNAPKVDRFGLPFNLAVVWASKLPGGLERLSCIMMAIFLFLAILSVQLYVGLLNKHQIRSRLSFLCTKPSSLEEVITFECRVTLLLLAWILSMLLAWLVLVCHFLYWCCIFRRPRSTEERFEEGEHDEGRQLEGQQSSQKQETPKMLDEVVTEESTRDKKED